MINSNWIQSMATRRQTLKGLFGAAGAGLALGAGLAPSAAVAGGHAAKGKEIDFTDPAERLRAFIKLTGDLNPEVETAGWYGGRVFAVLEPGTPLVPLYDVEGHGVLRCEEQEDGTFHVFNREVGYYKDIRTGEYLEEWFNPLTKETVEVKPIHNMTVNADLAPIMKMDFDGTMMEVPFPVSFEAMRDKYFSTFEVHTAFPNPMTVEKWPRESAGPMLRVSEVFQRNCSLADLQDPSLTSADHAGSWIRVASWMPWMLMGQAPGHMFYRCHMDKTGKVEDLPAKLLAYTEKKYPEYLQAPPPESWGTPNDSSFSVYMHENEPQPAK